MEGQGRPLAWWVALVDRLVDERLDAALDEHGVTREQWALLAALLRGPVPSGELPASATQDDVAELRESGWLTGEPLVLTERGRGAAERIAEVVEGIAMLIDSAVDPAERTVVAAALQASARSLGWSDEG